jgi:uncharacterized protein YxjI
MIFCRKCGRYSSDGTLACGTCGADLKQSGHASFQATSVKITLPVAVATTRPTSIPQKTAAMTATATAVLDPEMDPVSDTEVNSASDPEINPVFNRDKFLLRQKALAIKEKYYVTDDQGIPLMFVERPALLMQQLIMLGAVAATFFGGSFVMAFISGFIGTTLGARANQIISAVGVLGVLAATAFVFVLLVPKRHVTFYKDDRKLEPLLEIKQLNKIEFPYANFSILDTTGNIIGSLRKNVLFDYVRRRWQVKNAYGLDLCTAKEDSIILSLLRRTGIPIFLFLRTNFIFLKGNRVIGEFNRKLTLLDRYVLDLTADHQRTFDRRIALALGVMLDTGERR